MAFTTLTFFLFTALVWTAYWLLPTRRAQNVLLLIASYTFYGWWDARFCGLMALACSIDYWIGRGLARTKTEWRRKALLAVSLTTNLGILGYFKYCNFFLENLHVAATGLGWSMDRITLQVLLPVGISFYTFQTMSYVIDVYRRELKAGQSWLEYLAYISFFPQLVAGPIERAEALLPQFQSRRRFNEADAIEGCRMILWGLFKKMVVADGLSLIAQGPYGNVAGATGPQLAVATVAFAFQIYFDFSAYSEIAIGTARLFGFRLMRNFAYPYFSRSLSEFWRRWHISLSTWFRDYVFVPLGGSRVGRGRLALNLLATFLVSGFWHGASWNFIIWGGLMGAGVATEALVRRPEKRSPNAAPGGESLIPSLANLAAMSFVFAYVAFGWIFFRAATFDDALLTISKMATDLARPESYRSIVSLFAGRDQAVAAVVLPIVLLGEWLNRREACPLTLSFWPRPIRWTVYTAVLWITLILGPRVESNFIYFQF